MTIAPRTTPSMPILARWVRREIRDPATNADGSPRPEAARGWSDAEIDEAMVDAVIELQTEQAIRGNSQYIFHAEAEAQEGEVDVPAAVDGKTIESIQAQVQDRWITIIRGSDHAPDVEVLNEAPVFFRWTLRAKEGSGPAGLPSARIVITPRLTATLRIRYWDPTTVSTGGGLDQHALANVWGELVALLAARRLLAPDDDFTTQQEIALGRKMELYAQFHRPKGKRIRRIPR